MLAPRPVRRGRRLDFVRRPNRLLAPRRVVRKRTEPRTQAQPEPAKATEPLLESPTGLWISGVLHVVALTSFMIASGYACKFLLLIGFRIGALIGLAVYGALALISGCEGED